VADDEGNGSGRPRQTPAPLSDVLGEVVRRVVDGGRARIERAARSGRQRLEIRQLERDRDRFWIRLGKTAYRLAEGGEIDHPALRKAMGRIDTLDERIARMREAGPDGVPGTADDTAPEVDPIDPDH
jgi:hypothetical protein